jgi:hypothetical protein
MAIIGFYDVGVKFELLQVLDVTAGLYEKLS